jgi:hypothetical protein
MDEDTFDYVVVGSGARLVSVNGEPLMRNVEHRF